MIIVILKCMKYKLIIVLNIVRRFRLGNAHFLTSGDINLKLSLT